jgi:hypothetical protein
MSQRSTITEPEVTHFNEGRQFRKSHPVDERLNQRLQNRLNRLAGFPEQVCDTVTNKDSARFGEVGFQESSQESESLVNTGLTIWAGPVQSAYAPAQVGRAYHWRSLSQSLRMIWVRCSIPCCAISSRQGRNKGED